MLFGRLLNEEINVRYFALVGHRAMSKGKLPLNDLAGGAGRMDVLIRGLMAGLLKSHGIREDVEVILHLQGGPGPHRRLKFIGSELRGFHAEERSVAGLIAKSIKEPMPAIGQWVERSPGVYDGGGTLQRTLKEWQDTPLIRLDADAERLWNEEARLPSHSNSNSADVAFILSDDLPLEIEDGLPRSLGSTWLQGHLAIGLCHFLLDENVELNL